MVGFIADDTIGLKSTQADQSSLDNVMTLPLFSFRRVFFFAVMIALFTTGCALGGEQSAVLPNDGPPIPVSQDAAVSFAQKTLSSTESTGSGGEIHFTVTQQEVTSALSIGSQLLNYSQGGPIFEGIPGLEGIEGTQELEGLLDSQGSQVLEGSDVPPQIIDLLKNIQSEGENGLNLPDIRLKLEEPQVYFKGDGRIILRGYGRILRWRLPIRMVIAPHAAQGELALDFVEGQIGTLPMPEFLFDPLGKLLARVLLSGREYAEISELSVREGSLTFSGRLSLEP